jgi:hypothetical protein
MVQCITKTLDINICSKKLHKLVFNGWMTNPKSEGRCRVNKHAGWDRSFQQKMSKSITKNWNVCPLDSRSWIQTNVQL